MGITVSGPDTGYFFIMFSVLLVGFSIAGTQLFGAGAAEYKSIPNSLTSNCNCLLGEVYYFEMKDANKGFWAMMYFLAYVVIMFFIIVNVFLAILGDAYSVVKEEVDAEVEELNAAKAKSNQKSLLQIVTSMNAIKKLV